MAKLRCRDTSVVKLSDMYVTALNALATVLLAKRHPDAHIDEDTPPQEAPTCNSIT